MRLAWTVALAVALRLLYGVGDPGYDASYALLWGHEVSEGRAPDYEGPGSPTPHPLGNLVAVAAALLGGGAWDALVLTTYVALAALGVGAYVLGRVLFSRPVGVVFAALVVTRPLLVSETLEAFVDLPFLALVVWAAALAARSPRRGVPVLVLLALAGLLRPEAWLFAGAYALYLLRGAGPRERGAVVGLAASAPLLWALSDWAIAGDPLFSLHGTQESAEEAERPRGLGTAFDALPEYMEAVLRLPVLGAGLAGAAIGLAAFARRSALPAAIVALGLVTFFVFGVADLPLIARYLFPAATALALFAGLAAAGWTLAARRGPRLAWIALGLAAAGFVAADVPATEDEIAEQRRLTSERHDLSADLRSLAGSRAARATAAACPPIRVEHPRMIPPVTIELGVEHGEVDKRPLPIRAEGTLIRPASVAVAHVYQSGPQRLIDDNLGSRIRPVRLQPMPERGLRRVASNRSWVLYSAC